MNRDKEFTWLHLSDLHLRSKNDWDSERIIEGLISDLKHCAAKYEIHPDLIFFSGDAAFGATKEETISEQFAAVAQFFDQIRTAFSPAIPKSSFYIVPGNHDIDRNEVSPAETIWLRDKRRTSEDIINAQQNVTKQWRNWIERLRDYRRFLLDYGLEHLDPSHPALIWGQKVKIRGLEVGLCGFNSAWSCADDSDKGNLWTGGVWQIGETARAVKGCDVSIALVHHPSNWLRDDEDPAFGLRLTSDFNLLLHGHEHQARPERGEKHHVKISAGACYQCSWMPNGYSFGKASVPTGRIQVYFREWDNQGGGWIPKNIFGKTEDGVWTTEELDWLKKLQSKPAASNLGEEQTGEPCKTSLDASSIIQVESRPDEKVVKASFDKLKKITLTSEPQHQVVRAHSRNALLTILATSRCCFIRSDWQMGIDGFLASAIHEEALKENRSARPVFRVDCASTVNPDEAIDAAGTQLGMSYAEFIELAKETGPSVLIFDEVPMRKWENDRLHEDFRDKIQATVEFSPDLWIVINFRDDIPILFEPHSLELCPLDLADTQAYLKAHRQSNPSLYDPSTVDEIHHHTGGLPDALERLISLNERLTLREILNETTGNLSGNALAGAPESLRTAVESLASSTDKYALRSYELLKLLTVLKDGETFDSIKRFYPTKPFYTDNVKELGELHLLDSVPLAKSAEDLIRDDRLVSFSGQDRQKLLRVPRQVRDYVDGLISAEERAKIFRAASHAFFGEDWTFGKIKMRRSLFYAYKASSVLGPGNELVVAQYLLKSALDNRRKDRIEKYSELAVGYCAELMEKDRFRDVVIAANAIRNMLDPDNQKRHWCIVSAMLGTALRLTSQEKQSIQVLENLWKNYTGETKHFKSDILFDLGSCYKTIGEQGSALLCAEKILQLEPADSAIALQAKSLILRIKLKGGKSLAGLRSLYRIAESKGYKNAMTNIALDIARMSREQKESIGILDSIIKRAHDPYSKARAITRKADILREQGKLDLLTFDERIMLGGAYVYSYGQRLDHLLDSSHEALWDIFVGDSAKRPLFRIFRFSSFVWRLNGRTERESKYLNKLKEWLGAVSREDDLLEEVDYVSSRLENNLSCS